MFCFGWLFLHSFVSQLNLTNSLYEIELSAVSDSTENLYDFSDLNRLVIGYSMRTERYRHTEWIHIKSGKTIDMELYDHRDDDLENHNVAGDRPTRS
jgi:hypothetical protein